MERVTVCQFLFLVTASLVARSWTPPSAATPSCDAGPRPSKPTVLSITSLMTPSKPLAMCASAARATSTGGRCCRSSSIPSRAFLPSQATVFWHGAATARHRALTLSMTSVWWLTTPALPPASVMTRQHGSQPGCSLAAGSSLTKRQKPARRPMLCCALRACPFWPFRP